MTNAPVEHRSLVEPVEFRAEGTALRASGVAMRYESKSKPIGGQFREVFAAGSFARTITQQDVRSHNEHGGPYLARTGAGSLRLIDSRSELAYELDLPDTTAGRDTAALLERGDIKGSSIGFRAIPAQVKWTVDDDGLALRTVGEAELLLVDLTVAPAYGASTAALAYRSLADDLTTDIDALVEAANRGELPTLLGQSAEPPAEDVDDARETPIVVRERISWLTC